jgi:hypothetical protein
MRHSQHDSVAPRECNPRSGAKPTDSGAAIGFILVALLLAFPLLFR